VPRFGDSPSEGAEQDWLLLEIDPSATAASILPALLRKYLGSGYASEYDVEVTARGDASHVIYPDSKQDAGAVRTNLDHPDSSLNLFDVRVPVRGGPGGAPGGNGGGPGKDGKRPKGKEGHKGRAG